MTVPLRGGGKGLAIKEKGLFFFLIPTALLLGSWGGGGLTCAANRKRTFFAASLTFRRGNLFNSLKSKIIQGKVVRFKVSVCKGIGQCALTSSFQVHALCRCCRQKINHHLKAETISKLRVHSLFFTCKSLYLVNAEVKARYPTADLQSEVQCWGGRAGTRPPPGDFGGAGGLYFDIPRFWSRCWIDRYSQIMFIVKIIFIHLFQELSKD